MLRPSFFIAAGLTASVWGVVLALWVAPSAAPAPAQAYTPQNLREQFAVDLLARLGNNAPTLDTIAFVVAWTLAEDGGDGALSRNNPLNTTQSSGAVTQTINSDGVRGYETYQDGLDATVATITNGLYNPLVYALQTNDANGALQALIESPWAGSHYNGGASWPRVELSIGNPPVGAVASNPIGIGYDDCGWNVRVALAASGGALQQVTIPPGATWSFNATMGDPGAIPYRSCGGVPGGNWCNLAARYAQVARAFGADLQFQDHGTGDLGGGPENSVAIWNVGGQAGGQDLQITNRGPRPLHFGIQGDDTQVSVIAWEG